MIEIREVLPAEFETVGELTVQSYVGGGFVAGGSPYAERLRDTATRVEQGRVLVAVLGDEVVGSLTIAEPGTPFADVAQKGELEFRMLAVSPQARGSGAGTALVRAVIAEAYDRGDHSVVISTQPEDGRCPSYLRPQRFRPRSRAGVGADSRYGTDRHGSRPGLISQPGQPSTVATIPAR